jgi:hypothetical protein
LSKIALPAAIVAGSELMELLSGAFWQPMIIQEKNNATIVSIFISLSCKTEYN